MVCCKFGLAIVQIACKMPNVARPSTSIVRLKDIARKLNVSVSTVSRALGKDTCEMVEPELRAKILEMAEQANYVPHPAAQLMRKPKVHLITVLLPLETGAFMSEYYGVVLSGVISAARDSGTETRVALIDPDGGDILEQMQQVAIGAGGLLYMALPLTSRQLVRLEDFVRPVVVMGGSLPPYVELSSIHVNTVTVDTFCGGARVDDPSAEAGSSADWIDQRTGRRPRCVGTRAGFPRGHEGKPQCR